MVGEIFIKYSKVTFRLLTQPVTKRGNLTVFIFHMFTLTLILDKYIIK